MTEKKITQPPDAQRCAVRAVDTKIIAGRCAPSTAGGVLPEPLHPSPSVPDCFGHPVPDCHECEYECWCYYRYLAERRRRLNLRLDLKY